MPRLAPYGTWTSPISPKTVAEQGIRLGFVALDGDDVYWLEGRPAERGRNVLVRRDNAGVHVDVIPPDHNVRTRVQEYGGGAFIVADGIAYYSNFADQRIYRVQTDRPASAEAITPPGPWMYADAALDPQRARLICVCEDHSAPGHEPITTLVSIGLPRTTNHQPPTALVSGADFYSTPRVSPDGSRLSWLQWQHPQMPWDGSELWVADITATGRIERSVRIAGGPRESIVQPDWLPDGSLCFASDKTGWWQLYRMKRSTKDNVQSMAGSIVEPLLRDPLPEAEFGRPQWLFGWTTWAQVDARRLVVSYARRGQWSLATLDLVERTLTNVATTLEPLEWLAATATDAFYVAASPTTAPAVVRTNLSTGSTTVLRSSATLALSPSLLSVPEAIEFPTEGGSTAHAFYYPPRNEDHAGPAGEQPPLIVISHGGPTTQSKALLDLQVQFWTTRGFALVDVNYGGSSGYGRAYRQRLNGNWGIVDVDDCVNAAKYLVSCGKADAKRLIIRGGSAGGYTTFAALAFRPGVFAAGASYYGVSDAEALATDTHKFESRYLDGLIGPYPEKKDVYQARSPIHFVDRLSCALILFQGLEDRVVPPSQSERMADAVRAKGLPVAYLAFEGEQHGFRKAETIVRCLEAELYFYGVVFGFTPAGALPPIQIDNRPGQWPVGSRQ